MFSGSWVGFVCLFLFWSLYLVGRSRKGVNFEMLSIYFKVIELILGRLYEIKGR